MVEYALRLRVEPPAFMRHDRVNGRRSTEPVEVESAGVKVEQGQDWWFISPGRASQASPRSLLWWRKHATVPSPRLLWRSASAAFVQTASLPANYHDRAVSVAHDAFGDAVHQRSSYPAATPAAHRYQAGVHVLGEDHDLLRRPSQPEVGLRDPPPGGPDQPHLFVERPASFARHSRRLLLRRWQELLCPWCGSLENEP